jgi:hypothetical protein
MEALMNLLNSDEGKQIIKGISQETNQDENVTGDVLSMAMPMLMGAVKKNVSSPEGAMNILSALTSKHDGGIMDNLDVFFGGGVDDADKNEGEGLLGTLLGGSQDQVVNMIAGKKNIDVNTVLNILKVAAPIVMGYLGKENGQKGDGSAQGLESVLERFTGDGKQQGMIESLLDGDNDGSVLDDVAGMLLNSSSKSGGGIGSLLGGFLGKK